MYLGSIRGLDPASGPRNKGVTLPKHLWLGGGGACSSTVGLIGRNPGPLTCCLEEVSPPWSRTSKVQCRGQREKNAEEWALGVCGRWEALKGLF